MDKYNTKVDSKFFNVSIDGLDIIAEEINPSESFNRRETVRKNIIGGTQQVMRGGYIHRDYTITTHFMIDPEYPDIYDDIFIEWQSKPVEVISKELGGKFDAECIVKRVHDTPNFLKLEIQLAEIPTNVSNIPNDSMKLPADELSNTKITSSKTTTKTTNKTDTKTNKKNKGSNITQTKKNK